MSIDTELKADLIREDLSKQITDAVIAHQFVGGNHQFTIRVDGATYQIDFSERVLLEHPIRDLENAVPKLVKQLLAAGAPRRITVGERTVGRHARRYTPEHCNAVRVMLQSEKPSIA
jgi:hypothetical protein